MDGRTWSETTALELIRSAEGFSGEGGALDITNLEYQPEDLAALRSRLMSMRRAIDVVSRALADAWDYDFKYDEFDDGANIWYLGRTKGKKLIDPDAFYDWLATQDARKLRSLVSASAVKVGGFTPVERENFLDETPAHDTLSVKSKKSDMPMVGEGGTT